LRVENFLFDLGVNLRGEADLFREICLAISMTVLQFVILVEPFLDFVMVFLQDVERIAGRLPALVIAARGLRTARLAFCIAICLGLGFCRHRQILR
jgi:hypothetical protein